MANKVFMATSLDGFIADNNGGVDWLNDPSGAPESDGGFAEFMDTIDAMVMGRNTYEKILSFDCDWPYTKKVFVLSNTLKNVDTALTGQVEIANGDPHNITRTLNDLGYPHLYIDGGQTVQNFLQQGLIDEITITRIPALLGSGIPLFGPLEKMIKLRHSETKTFGNRMVQSRYMVEKD